MSYHDVKFTCCNEMVKSPRVMVNLGAVVAVEQKRIPEQFSFEQISIYLKK